jgi:hypothetical protein
LLSCGCCTGVGATLPLEASGTFVWAGGVAFSCGFVTGASFFAVAHPNAIKATNRTNKILFIETPPFEG